MKEADRLAIAKMFQDYADQHGPVFEFLTEKCLLAPYQLETLKNIAHSVIRCIFWPQEEARVVQLDDSCFGMMMLQMITDIAALKGLWPFYFEGQPQSISSGLLLSERLNPLRLTKGVNLAEVLCQNLETGEFKVSTLPNRSSAGNMNELAGLYFHILSAAFPRAPVIDVQLAYADWSMSFGNELMSKETRAKLSLGVAEKYKTYKAALVNLTKWFADRERELSDALEHHDNNDVIKRDGVKEPSDNRSEDRRASIVVNHINLNNVHGDGNLFAQGEKIRDVKQQSDPKKGWGVLLKSGLITLVVGMLVALFSFALRSCDKKKQNPTAVDDVAVADKGFCPAATYPSVEDAAAAFASSRHSVFIGCTFNYNSGRERVDIPALNARPKDAGPIAVVSPHRLAQDVVVGTNGWPQLENPKGLTIVVKRMMERLSGKDAKGAVELAKTADAIIATHWGAYTNKSMSVTREFATNVAQTYVTLSQDAMSRDDWESAGRYCNLAVQFMGKKVQPEVSALRLACCVRYGKGKMLVMEDKLIRLFKSIYETNELYAILNCLAQWGYIVPFAIDFDHERLVPTDWGKKFGFDKPLEYAMMVKISMPTNRSVESLPVIFQRKGFDGFETVNLNDWLRETVKLFKNDKRLQNRDDQLLKVEKSGANRSTTR